MGFDELLNDYAKRVVPVFTEQLVALVSIPSVSAEKGIKVMAEYFRTIGMMRR